MQNNSFLFITPNKVENYAHTRINHNYESFVLPPEFIVEIKNKFNGTNLLSEYYVNQNDISLKNAFDEKINFEVCIIDDKPYINLSSLGWKEGFHDYELNIGSDVSINFSLEMRKVSRRGKEFYDKSNFLVYDNYNSNENGIISIEV